MPLFRRHLVWLTCCLALCEVAGLSVTSAAVCSVCLSSTDDAPLYAHQEGTQACHVGNACLEHDAALLALAAGLSAPLPDAVCAAPSVSAVPLGEAWATTIARLVRPESPPPRG